MDKPIFLFEYFHSSVSFLKYIDNEEILNFVNEIKMLIKEDRYNNGSYKDLEKDYPDKIKNSEERLLNCIGENDLKILKTEFCF